MANKLDCTEKAWSIMMKHTTWRKPLRMTSKRQRYIDIMWPRWKKYRDAMVKANLYQGCAWSGDSKWPKVDINTKEKFIESLLTQHCTSHTFNITLENAR
jgi:hypothetical protein